MSADDREVYNVKHRSPFFSGPIQECGLVSPDGSFPKWAQVVSFFGRASLGDYACREEKSVAQLKALRAVLVTTGAVGAIECLIETSNGSHSPIKNYLFEIGAIENQIEVARGR